MMSKNSASADTFLIVTFAYRSSGSLYVDTEDIAFFASLKSNLFLSYIIGTICN